ncbi:MAG: type II toxin-antitoxin system RelE/ParE family toxin [Clostridiales bacterium]|jgi:plasmid stabilization system protein ParE|nr:type II toxin-antitoxin system RelE/ParE family toxin [Clostridiales bacterium]
MENELYTFKLLKKAKQDLRNIYDHIAFTLKNQKAAKDLNEKFDKAIQRLTYFPNSGEPYEKQFKRIFVDNYTVFYTVYDDKKLLIINRILYARMNFKERI